MNHVVKKQKVAPTRQYEFFEGGWAIRSVANNAIAVSVAPSMFEPCILQLLCEFVLHEENNTINYFQVLRLSNA